MANKLYVGNLSFETTERDLQDCFAQAGTVQQTELMQDRVTGKSRGFGFVTMSTEEEVQKAIHLFHGKDFMNRPLTVSEARPISDNTGGGPRRAFGKSEGYSKRN